MSLPAHHAWTHRSGKRGGTDPQPPLGMYQIKVFADRDALDGNLPDEAIIVSAGDGKFIFPIPPDLHRTELILAEAGVSVVGSGDLDITIRNLTQSVEMLTSTLTIPSGDYNSFPPVATAVNEANAVVEMGDRISINVDADGGGTAEGLSVILWFEL